MFVQVCFLNIWDDYDTEISRFYLKARPSFEWDVNGFFFERKHIYTGRLTSSGVNSVIKCFL